MIKERTILSSIATMCLIGTIVSELLNKQATVGGFVCTTLICAIGITCIVRANKLLLIEMQEERKRRKGGQQNTDNR